MADKKNFEFSYENGCKDASKKPRIHMEERVNQCDPEYLQRHVKEFVEYQTGYVDTISKNNT